MSIEKKYVPHLEKFMQLIQESPDYLQKCINADAIIGPTDTVLYIENMRKNMNQEVTSKKGKIIP